MNIQLKYKQDAAMRENMEAYARAQHELQQKDDVKSEISSDKISYGTTYHQPTYAYAPPPNYNYQSQPAAQYYATSPKSSSSKQPYKTLAAN